MMYVLVTLSNFTKANTIGSIDILKSLLLFLANSSRNLHIANKQMQ